MKKLDIPEWFDGQLYDKGEKVKNEKSGQEFELNNVELSIYDYLMGCHGILCLSPSLLSEKNKSNFSKSIEWFKENNPEAYTLLIHQIVEDFSEEEEPNLEQMKNINELINFRNIKWLDHGDDFEAIKSLNNFRFFLMYKMSKQGGCFQLRGDDNNNEVLWKEDYEYFNGGDVDGDEFNNNKKVFENEYFDTIFLYEISSDEFKAKLFEKIREYKQTNSDFYFNEFCDSLNVEANPDDCIITFTESILGKDISKQVLYDVSINKNGNFISWCIWEQVYSEEFKIGVLDNS